MTDLRKFPDLATLFAHFARTVTKPSDQPMGVAPEDNKVNKHYEQQLIKNNERGQHY